MEFYLQTFTEFCFKKCLCTVCKIDACYWREILHIVWGYIKYNLTQCLGVLACTTCLSIWGCSEVGWYNYSQTGEGGEGRAFRDCDTSFYRAHEGKSSGVHRRQSTRSAYEKKISRMHTLCIVHGLAHQIKSSGVQIIIMSTGPRGIITYNLPPPLPHPPPPSWPSG